MLRAIDQIQTFEHGIVHGDLKPANFLFINGELKLIDFGIAKVCILLYHFNTPFICDHFSLSLSLHPSPLFRYVPLPPQ